MSTRRPGDADGPADSGGCNKKTGIPELAPNIARLVLNKVASCDRSCPEIPQKMPESSSNVVPATEIRTISGNFVLFLKPLLTDCGKDSVQNRSMCPNLGRIGPLWPRRGPQRRILVELGQMLAKCRQYPPMNLPMLVELGQTTAKVCHEDWPRSANVGKNCPTSDPNRKMYVE